LDVRKEGNEEFLYHCDIANRLVVKTKLDGTVMWEKGVPQEPGVYKDGAPFVPTNVAFSPNGDFYVADGYGSNWIHQYDIKGNHIRTFGGPGSEPGKVQQPHGCWVDTRQKEPLLAIADRANHRIQYFSLDGKHVRFDTAGMRLPCHFSLRKDLMLVPDLQSVVTILDSKNRVVVHLGDGDPSSLRDHPRKDFVPGKFIHPHDAIFLRNGDILVAEWVPIGRVTLLRKVKR
jgi:DNA-binding beta-propeller fold protein YncE